MYTFSRKLTPGRWIPPLTLPLTVRLIPKTPYVEMYPLEKKTFTPFPFPSDLC